MRNLIHRLWLWICSKWGHNEEQVSDRDLFSRGEIINNTAGGRHAWFNSSVGKIRKPI